MTTEQMIFYSSGERWQVRGIVSDLIRERGLLLDFFLRHLRARYRNAMMGFLWAIIHPLLLTLILLFVFVVVFQTNARGNLRQSAMEILTKVIFWQYLASSVLSGMQSLIENQNLIKKTSFSREILPLAASFNCLVNLGIGMIVLLGAHVLLIGTPPWSCLWIPLVFCGEFLLTLGTMLLVSALNVRYRDTGYLVEIGLTFGFYASPVLYPLEWVQNSLSRAPMLLNLYYINPVVGYLDMYQKLISGVALEFSNKMMWPVVCSIAVLLIGAVVFRKMSATFADYL